MTSRRGFSLVEIMVAMTILVVALGDFAVITFWYVRNTAVASVALERGAVMNGHVQRLSVLPFDSLTSRAGCTDKTTGPMPYRLCVSVLDVNPAHKTVTLIVTPARLARSDTTTIERTTVAAANPLLP